MQSAEKTRDFLEKRYDFGLGEPYSYDTLSMPLNTVKDDLASEFRIEIQKGEAQRVLKHVARSLCVDDYVHLGRKCGYIYKGVHDVGSLSPDPTRIRTTFFHSSAS